LYDNSLSDYDIAKILDEQLESGTEIVFETATSGIKRVQSINRLTNIGINWRKATKGKGSVLAGIRNLSQYHTIYITDMSPNIKREMENYSWVDNDKGELIPQDKFNHAIDAVRYAEEFYLSKYGTQQIQSDLS
jgi:phage terminase large subunit